MNAADVCREKPQFDLRQAFVLLTLLCVGIALLRRPVTSIPWNDPGTGWMFGMYLWFWTLGCEGVVPEGHNGPQGWIAIGAATGILTALVLLFLLLAACCRLLAWAFPAIVEREEPKGEPGKETT